MKFSGGGLSIGFLTTNYPSSTTSRIWKGPLSRQRFSAGCYLRALWNFLPVSRIQNQTIALQLLIYYLLLLFRRSGRNSSHFGHRSSGHMGPPTACLPTSMACFSAWKSNCSTFDSPWSSADRSWAELPNWLYASRWGPRKQMGSNCIYLFSSDHHFVISCLSSQPAFCRWSKRSQNW